MFSLFEIINNYHEINFHENLFIYKPGGLLKPEGASAIDSQLYVTGFGKYAYYNYIVHTHLIFLVQRSIKSGKNSTQL